MHIDRRRLLAALSAAGLASASGDLLASSTRTLTPHLYRVDDPKLILAAARTLFTTDAIGTLITVDLDGRPRARSIVVSAPDHDLSFWMGTRRGSRKLDQLAANPQATLHFADDKAAAYVSLMGHARAYTDPATIRAKNPYKGAELAHYFPHFPDDFVLLGFKPQWLEVATSTLPSKPDTWQPQGLSL